MGVDLEDGDVGGGVVSDDRCVDLVAAREAHLERAGAGDDEVASDDVTGLVDDEARPERLMDGGRRRRRSSR